MVRFWIRFFCLADCLHQGTRLWNELDAFDRTVIEERNKDIAELDSQMAELNEIFRDVASLVQEQGDALDVIESSIVASDVKCVGGHMELDRASKLEAKTL